MWKMRPAIWMALLVLLPFANFRLAAESSKKSEGITVTGTLVRVAGIGGETTGWSINLDSETEIRGEKVKSIEVSGNEQQLSMLENQHVTAKGKLVSRHGVTRGNWTVLQVTVIRKV